MIQPLIDELKQKVEKLPREANWFGNVDHIRQLIKEIEQALQQAHVSGSLPPVEQDLLDEAVSDVITICALNMRNIATKLIKEQYYVVAKEDLLGGNDR